MTFKNKILFSYAGSTKLRITSTHVGIKWVWQSGIKDHEDLILWESARQ